MTQNDDPWFGGNAASRPLPSTDPFGLAGPAESVLASRNSSAGWTPRGSGAPLVARPIPMHVAFGVLALAAVLSLLTALLGVLTILDLQGRVQNLVGMEPSGAATLYTDDYIDGATIALVFAMVAVAAAFAFGYVTFARGVYQGKHWPRVWASGLAVVSLFGLLGGPLVVTIVLLGLVAVALLWLPVSRRYCDYASTR
ncbi:hypothetical protein E5720_16650 [Rhodococcus sp. PAMC28707]|uniref:hypothetical protein n=1 Tax=unclassified Rhodococcus (in: high G+C Gram-positive bacteria) TaxID=192944 RepID=UPI00109DDE8E|nr:MULTISPECIES: hypothetical protein [unclassified Rhodococcus (in: high G+C Gram-positive bacteria)]QCB51950.1 hypothetical protein E5769_18870 [Rhodococcus sp. PAMC28705]QCB59880.1 hypothetical protein E5720_16650 [Rhodococcus sp. PAMC28707]